MPRKTAAIVIIVTACAVISACSEDTSIFLTVETPLAIPTEMDELSLTIDESGKLLYEHKYTPKPGEPMTLFIWPGTTEEYTIHITAAALKDGVEMAFGETTAKFSNNRKVYATIQLSTALARHDDGGYDGDNPADSGPDGSDSGFIPDDSGNDGGFDGSAEDPDSGPDAATDAGCINKCENKGAGICYTQTSIQICDDHNSDSCLELGEVQSCGDNAICELGECKCAGAIYANCDNDFFLNGCETDTITSNSHCGECNKPCDPALMHVEASFCDNGKCNYTTCVLEYEDQDPDRSNGCETWNYFPKAYTTEDGVISPYNNNTLFYIKDSYYLPGVFMTPENNFDGLLMKLNNVGDLEWSKRFAAPKVDFFTNIIPTLDGNLILSGISNSFTTESILEFVLLKINPNGIIIWQKKLSSSCSDSAAKLFAIPDGGFILATKTTTQYKSNISIVKLASNGSLEWQKNYTSSDGIGVNDYQLTENGGFLISGYIKTGTQSSLLLVKTDKNGNIEKSLSLPIETKHDAIHTISNNDNHFIILIDFQYILTTDDKFENIVIKKIFSDTLDINISSVFYSKNGNIIIYGRSHNSDNTDDSLLVNLDQQSNIIWANIIKSQKNNTTHGMVEQNNGYFGFIETDSPSGADKQEFRIMQYSLSGEPFVPCGWAVTQCAKLDLLDMDSSTTEILTNEVQNTLSIDITSYDSTEFSTTTELRCSQ